MLDEKEEKKTEKKRRVRRAVDDLCGNYRI